MSTLQTIEQMSLEKSRLLAEQKQISENMLPGRPAKVQRVSKAATRMSYRLQTEPFEKIWSVSVTKKASVDVEMFTAEFDIVGYPAVIRASNF